MRTITRINQLSGNLAALVAARPTERPEERFYLCPAELAAQMESAALEIGTLERHLHRWCLLNGIRLPPDWEDGSHFAMGGSEAEERWPTLILAGQLWPIQVQSLGVKQATWSELLWAARISSENRVISFNPGTKAQQKPINLLALLRWRAHWAPMDWLEPSEETPPADPSAAANADLKSTGEGAASLRNQQTLSMLSDRIEVRKDQHWSQTSWKETGHAEMVERLTPTTWVNNTQDELLLKETIKQAALRAASEPAGYIEWPKADGRRGEITLAWGPLPEAGQGMTLVAISYGQSSLAMQLIATGSLEEEDQTRERTLIMLHQPLSDGRNT